MDTLSSLIFLKFSFFFLHLHLIEQSLLQVSYSLPVPFRTPFLRYLVLFCYWYMPRNWSETLSSGQGSLTMMVTGNWSGWAVIIYSILFSLSLVKIFWYPESIVLEDCILEAKLGGNTSALKTRTGPLSEFCSTTGCPSSPCYGRSHCSFLGLRSLLTTTCAFAFQLPKVLSLLSFFLSCVSFNIVLFF